MIDIAIMNAGSIVVLSGTTVKGQEWLSEHMPEDCQRWGMNGYVVEPRYLHDIVIGITDDGLEVE